MRRRVTDPASNQGVFRGDVSFDTPALRGYYFPCVEITGERPGPRLCVTAGVHVNEVSSIEAAIRLPNYFTPVTLRGSVSIIPAVNQPAWHTYTEYTCPVDGKNINFSFPGRSDGSFSEALCNALLYEWAPDADVYVDLHGGDLREEVAKFVMFQRVGDSEIDAERAEMANCFDADFVVGLEAHHLGSPGRAITARASIGRHGVMSEAGAHGIVDVVSVEYHVNGVLSLAKLLGMIDRPPLPCSRDHIACDRYLWVPCTADGFLRCTVEPGERVVRGQTLGVLHDVFGTPAGQIVAPESGYVLWRITHPVMRAGDSAFGLGCPAQD
jgi:uncharacterized protein